MTAKTVGSVFPLSSFDLQQSGALKPLHASTNFHRACSKLLREPIHIVFKAFHLHDFQNSVMVPVRNNLESVLSDLLIRNFFFLWNRFFEIFDLSKREPKL